jgi:protein-S-isoprenylcysteine O-methyltransferase Ste14
MYLALVLILFALALYFKNVTCFGVIPLLIGYITQYQIKPEEVMLNKIFRLITKSAAKKYGVGYK